LARREHSRAELLRKLAPHASDEQEVADLLDALEQAGHLSADRFVESLVRRRGAKYGVRRVAQELAEHRIAPALQAPVLAELKAAEPDRAWEAWQRRFGRAPTDVSERARQYRFLTARGFSGEAVAGVFKRLRGLPADGDE
jgi:regulatory protein